MKQGWEIKKLGEVCTIERGGSPRPIDAYITDEENGINWIKIGDATPNSRYITSTKEKIKPEGVRKSRMVYKGDFILSNSMSFGRPYILDVDGCIHDGWLVLRDKENIFDKSFLYYYLSSPFIYQEFKRLAVGGVVNNLNSELVRGVNVFVPPIAEQEKIVAELDCLSGIIEKKKQQLKELDNLAQSIFYEMFGDPVENDKGWEVKKLSYVCPYITDGSHYSPRAEDIGEIPMLSVKDMRQNRFSYDNCKMISYDEYLKLLSAGCKPNKGDVLIAKDGSYFKYIFEVKEDREQAVLSSIAIVRPDVNLINSSYLVGYLSTSDIYKYVERELLTGTAIKRVILKGLRNMKVIIPPLSLQQDFASKIESIEKQKELIAQSIKETETLFNSRMDYYFN